MAGVGLGDGTRVAVVGGGVSGAAFACSLLSSARAYGRELDVTIYEADSDKAVRAPLVLDPDSRCRLAALGAAFTRESRTVELKGVALWAGGRTELLPAPPGGLWLVDGAPDGEGGSWLLRKSLLMNASLRGAHVKQRRVEVVERAPKGQVVRAEGEAETYDVVAGAFGASSNLSGAWLQGLYRPPKVLLGSHARLELPRALDAATREMAHVCFAVTPSVDVLAIVPGGTGLYACALGADAGPHALVEALAVLARDGLLAAGFGLGAIERVAVPAGASSRASRHGQLVLGNALAGHPLESGLLPALVSAMRSASALVDWGVDDALLEPTLKEALDGLKRHARAQAKTLKWARHAGSAAADGLGRVVMHERTGGGPSLGLFGLPALPASAGLKAVRRAAWGRFVARAFGAPEDAPVVSERRRGDPLVFVVDDDADVRALLGDYLRSQGLTVEEFADESKVLEAAARLRPSAIVMDVVLNWVDGLSLCRALRAHPATAGVRLISMSGLCRPADRDAALAAGADAFFPKPLDLDALVRSLATMAPEAFLGARGQAAAS